MHGISSDLLFCCFIKDLGNDPLWEKSCSRGQVNKSPDENNIKMFLKNEK